MARQQAPKKQQDEMVQAQQEINLGENEELDAVQNELEERIKNDLDQLTVIVNNKYAHGKHVFDY